MTLLTIALLDLNLKLFKKLVKDQKVKTDIFGHCPLSTECNTPHSKYDLNMPCFLSLCHMIEILSIL